MFKYFLIIAFRSFLRQKAYAFINIAGFAIGIAACLFILMRVKDETGYDRFHEKADRIYRVVITEPSHSQARTPHPLAQAMSSELPEVEHAVSLSPIWGMGLTRAEYTVTYKDKTFDESGLFSADSTFFEVFGFPLLAGDRKTALAEPFCILVTRDIATKYFGSVENAMGQLLRFNNALNFKVNGVLENIPENSHFTFDFLVSYVTLKQMDLSSHGGRLSDYYTWNDFGHYNYLVLKPGADPKEVERKLPGLLGKHIRISSGDEERIRNGQVRLWLQPMTDIHLRSELRWELGTNGSIAEVRILTATAVLILLIACINFMNLSTARFTRRSREVGVRKILGISRGQLTLQFLSESAIYTVIAAVLALALADLFMPLFNSLTGKSLALSQFARPDLIACYVLGVLVTGVLSGLYPAFYLSSFRPLEVFRANVRNPKFPLNTRKVLVIVQFVISIVLIFMTIVIFRQAEHMRRKDLGFNKDQVITVPMKDDAVKAKFEVMRAALMRNPDILSVSGASNVPGGQFNINPIAWNPAEETNVEEMWADTALFRLLGLRLLKGSFYEGSPSSDTVRAVVLNEAAAGLSHLADPVGSELIYYGDEQLPAKIRVTGVVKDFNFHSVRERITPLLIHPGAPQRYNTLLIRIRKGTEQRSLDYIGKTFKTFDLQHPFRYSFLDETFKDLYRDEARMGSLFRVFSCLAVLVACLGLLGLSAFVNEQRTKEIGIRKVNGATAGDIVLLLSAGFFRWILLAAVIALPLAGYLSMHWLSHFAYPTNIPAGIYFLSAGLVLLSSAVTIGYQVLKTARVNASGLLRYE